MERTAVLKSLKVEARKRGLEYDETELTNHTGVTIGDTRSTLGRHSEIDDLTARKFWDQFAAEFGKGWWR